MPQNNTWFKENKGGSSSDSSCTRDHRWEKSAKIGHLWWYFGRRVGGGEEIIRGLSLIFWLSAKPACGAVDAKPDKF